MPLYESQSKIYEDFSHNYVTKRHILTKFGKHNSAIVSNNLK